MIRRKINGMFSSFSDLLFIIIRIYYLFPLSYFTEKFNMISHRKIFVLNDVWLVGLVNLIVVENYALKKTRLKITQLEKVRFIKVNKLKLTRVELS